MTTKLYLRKAMGMFLMLLALPIMANGQNEYYDFSAECPTGQTLYYKFIYPVGSYVSLVAPNEYNWDGYDKPRGDIELPFSVMYGDNEYFVTSIGKYAFCECNELTGSLNIPTYVTSIGERAFELCTGLTSLTISNSVTSIGERAFGECTGLTSLTISNSVISIGNYAFTNCLGLTSLTIPNSVTSIGEGAFGGCLGLTSLTISKSVTTISMGAFSGCSGLTGSLTIPNSVTSIEEGAFWDCRGFDGSLSIPSSVTSIGEGAFPTGWNSIHVDDGNPVYYSTTDAVMTRTDNVLVLGCKNTIIPNNVTAIGDYAFYFCDGLTGSLIIPNSVTSIGAAAFNNCSGLTSLTISDSATTIGIGAFSGCNGFTGSLTIPNSVTSIGADAFRGCSGFTGSLTIPNSVTSIGADAFNNCSRLTGSLTIPSSVTSIGHFAFHTGWTSISVDIDNTVYYSQDNALITKTDDVLILGCKNTVIPEHVTAIGECAFWGCSGLTGSLTIPNSVTSICHSAFYECSGLTGSLTIPNSVTSIGSYAFYKCSGLTGSLTIPNSVTSIGDFAFYECSGLTGLLIIPNAVTSISSSAFEGCSGFIGLTIPSSVTKIDSDAFENCIGLKSIAVHSAVPPQLLISTPFHIVPKDIPVYVPCGSIDAYKTAWVWNEFTNYQEFPNEPTFANFSGEAWSTLSNWVWGALPQATDAVVISGTCQLDTDATVASLTVTDGKSITVQDGKTLTVTSALTTDNVTQLVIEDGGHLINHSPNVQATVEKNVDGYGNDENPNGWYTIASPVVSMEIDGSDLINNNGEYDLYRYNEEQALWENYKANHFTLDKGRGYLYAKKDNGTISFKGELTTGDVAAPLSRSCPVNGMQGWNLIANPYMHDIAMGSGDGFAINTNDLLQDGYYSQSNSGAWEPHTISEPIAPTTGILVKATASEDNFTIRDIEATPTKAYDRIIRIAVSDGKTCDLTYLVCGDGTDLDKMEHLDEAIPSIYGVRDGERRGISYIGNDRETTTMPIGFKAGRVAAYTISASAQGGFDYLHLFDKMSGNDVDLLAEGAYRFYGSPADDSERFEIRFSPSVGIDEDEAGSTFAYFANGSVVVGGVDGEGLLEVFDVAGRRVASHSVSSSPAVVAMPDCKAGVYVVRLCSGDGVKVQKIVVY